MVDLVALFTKVSALKPAERKVLANKAKKALPALGGFKPNTPAEALLTTEFIQNSEWYIPPEELERVRQEAQWNRVSLELNEYVSTCKCCGSVQRYAGDTFVRFEHRSHKGVTRLVNRTFRADQTDLLLPRGRFVHEIGTAYCSTCFDSAQAEIEAWKAQLEARTQLTEEDIRRQFVENRVRVEEQERKERLERAAALAAELHALANELDPQVQTRSLVEYAPPWYSDSRYAHVAGGV
jgi:hypothetical protein